METRKTMQRTTTKEKLTPFQQQCIEVVKSINEYKLNCEANVVSILYKNPDKLRESNLKLEDFNNNTWKVYFNIINDIIMVEKKDAIDEIIVGIYLEKHPQLRKKYDEYGGYDTINAASTYVKEEAFDGYLAELRKWSALIKMAKHGWVDKNRMSEYVDMSAEEIYDEYNAYLNDIFVNIDNDVKSYNGFDGLHELIAEANEGVNVGLPFNNAPLLTKEVGGFNLNGNIYGLGAASGVGKSTMAINYLFPSAVKYNEPIVYIINEQDEKNFRKEALLWVCTNILKTPIPKYKFRDGKFDEETLEILNKAADWLEEKKSQRLITIIPLEKYSAKTVCKLIKKYSSIGNVRLFCLDTLKESFDARNVETHKSMERDMVDIYNVVKPAGCNVGLFVTYQISKGSIKTRHLTNYDIGQAKSIVDVMSTCLLARRPFEDEYEGGKRELKCFKLEGKNGKSKVPFKLKEGKHYMLTFIGKNRFGSTDEYTIVSECDLSINQHNDIGYCIVPEDF